MRYGLLLIGVLFLFSSCSKQREKNIQVSKDYALYQNDLSTILPLIIHCTKNKEYFNKVLFDQEDTLNTCASFSLISGDTNLISNGPIVFAINYTDCLDKDNFTKNGEIEVKLFNYTESVGGNLVLVLNDFEIANSRLNGSISITRFALNKYRIATSNFSVIKDGKSIIYDAFISYNLEPNSSANDLFDNYLTVTDKDVFVNRNGDEYQVLNNGLYRSMGCSYFSLGKIEIVDSKNSTQVLDFGNGGCENEATVTFDDDLFSIAIK